MTNNMTEQEAALRKVQEAAFVTHEAALFLDSHPQNSTALRYHQKAAGEYQTLRDAYEAKWGSITSMKASEDSYKTGMWQWIVTPWPWETAYPAASDNPDNNMISMAKEGK